MVVFKQEICNLSLNISKMGIVQKVNSLTCLVISDWNQNYLKFF
jgi:hypothetical protein